MVIKWTYRTPNPLYFILQQKSSFKSCVFYVFIYSFNFQKDKGHSDFQRFLNYS